MSRVLLTWELGTNLGHLAKLLPLARRLNARGHQTVVAVRDLPIAATVFVPAGILFVQCPLPTAGPTKSGPPSGYAEMLWRQGWGDQVQLRGLLEGWVNLFRLVNPDIAVLNFSPTARLAAGITKTPCLLVGTGFELPPRSTPLPPFPRSAPSQRAAAAIYESTVLNNANNALRLMHQEQLGALSDVVGGKRFLATVPELDHYGARPAESYVGPLDDLGDGEHINWPASRTKRIFAYLRPTTPALPNLLRALTDCDAAVIAFVPGVSASLLASHRRSDLIFTKRPVRFDSVLRDADLCISYAAAGTVLESLLRGVPNLSLPPHPEAELTAYCVEELGAGLTLFDAASYDDILRSMQELMNDSGVHARANAFAKKYADLDRADALNELVAHIEGCHAHSVNGGSAESNHG